MAGKASARVTRVQTLFKLREAIDPTLLDDALYLQTSKVAYFPKSRLLFLGTPERESCCKRPKRGVFCRVDPMALQVSGGISSALNVSLANDFIARIQLVCQNVAVESSRIINVSGCGFVDDFPKGRCADRFIECLRIPYHEMIVNLTMRKSVFNSPATIMFSRKNNGKFTFAGLADDDKLQDVITFVECTVRSFWFFHNVNCDHVNPLFD